ncbi:helix-turn-helix domain-containing protein [Pontimonas sp.]|uniref:helix-turn-helix domain-containing protein n=1 Tax=Pontimonas sp. TaxID=2304492 RepID=UPI00287065D7|nr:XRE family transcriptional regulator [Pontimonas sp.]MDR9396564.1 XRE family transcriptional regulator [Pontimonas sp.]
MEALSPTELFEEAGLDEATIKRGVDTLWQSISGYQLRELRRAAGFTQVQLASILGVSQNRVSRLERGQLDTAQLDTLRHYIHALGGELHIEVHWKTQRIALAPHPSGISLEDDAAATAHATN